MVKKNKIVYLGILGTILINCFGAGIVSAYEYACEFRDLTTCTGNWANIVVKISDTSNAHAEEWDQSNYNYGICCNWTTTSRTFSPPTTNITHILFNLSDTTNAHASVKYGTNPFNYPIIYAPMMCEALSGGCVDPYFMPVASISSLTGENAHLGNPSAYSYQICCIHPLEPEPPPECQAPNNICTIPQVCYNGESVVASGLSVGESCCSGTCCTPQDCVSQNYECGMQEDSCGYSLNCGDCSAFPPSFVCNDAIGQCLDTTTCILSQARWSTDFAWEGTDVFLEVYGSEGCSGELVDLTIRQNKVLTNPQVDDPGMGGIQPAPPTFDASGFANATWTAEWHAADPIIGNLPEYFFVAEHGSFEINSETPNLRVNSTTCEGILYCGDYTTQQACQNNVCWGIVEGNHETQEGYMCGQEQCNPPTVDSWYDCGCIWDNGACKFASTEFSCGEIPAQCGDEVRQAGEACDCIGTDCTAAQVNNVNCTDFNYQGGPISCLNCELQYDSCIGFECNNDGIVDFGNETCDGSGTGANFSNVTGIWDCTDFDEFTTGSLICDNCEIDTSACSRPSQNEQVEFGTCVKGQISIAGCDEVPVGFYVSTWEGTYMWGHTGYPDPWGEDDCEIAYGGSDGDCVQNPIDGLWYYSPDYNRQSSCEGIGQSVIECPAEIKLFFFDYYNLAITIILIGAIYICIVLRKKQ